MLNAYERRALHEIEYHLLAEDPALILLFHGVESRVMTDRRWWVRMRVLILASALAWFALLGPRVLDESEVTARKSSPLPRTSLPGAALDAGPACLEHPGAPPGSRFPARDAPSGIAKGFGTRARHERPSDPRVEGALFGITFSYRS